MRTSSTRSCDRSQTIAQRRRKVRAVTTIVLYALMTTALWYLLSRAMITKSLWSRYPAWLDYYTSCAACSGFLYGGAVALVIGWTQDLPFLGLPGRFWPTPIVVGLGSLVWTPILGEIHIRALLQLGVADPRGETAVDPPTETPNAQT
jgi:hypothetical protein